MEQQLPTGLAELVDNDEIWCRRASDSLPQRPAFSASSDEVEEAAARPGADDRGGDRDRQVNLAGAGTGPRHVQSRHPGLRARHRARVCGMVPQPRLAKHPVGMSRGR